MDSGFRNKAGHVHFPFIIGRLVVLPDNDQMSRLSLRPLANGLRKLACPE